MSVILLVRHGQASFGKADYDLLSDVGERQSRVLGRSLAARGIDPDLLVTGAMKRHRQTLDHTVDSAGWDGVTVTVDEGWNEFDHEHVIEVHKPHYKSQMVMKADLVRTLKPRQAFQAMFEEATRRWAGGEFDDEYKESFTAFSSRVEEALIRTAAALEPKQTAVVFTSGGPIAAVAAAILSPSGESSAGQGGAGQGGAELWGRLNITTINTAVTKVVVGGRGQTLVSMNDHSHLESAEPGLVTYR